MISPFTPPGTKVVCINADRDFARVPGFATYDEDCSWPIREGAVYTVLSIQPANVPSLAKLDVALVEIDEQWSDGIRWHRRCFAITRFRRAELPSCLTELLDAAPVSQDKELLEALK